LQNWSRKKGEERGEKNAFSETFIKEEKTILPFSLSLGERRERGKIVIGPNHRFKGCRSG
jgi:hypothetical protein